MPWSLKVFLEQRFSEVFTGGKLGMDRRWEDLDGSWRNAASPDFVRGFLLGHAIDSLIPERTHVGLASARGCLLAKLPAEGTSRVAGNCQKQPYQAREEPCFSIVGQASLPVIDARSATVTKVQARAGHARELLISKFGRHLSQFPRDWLGSASPIDDRQGRLSHYFLAYLYAPRSKNR